MTLEKKKTTATPKRVASYAPEDTIDTRLIKACFEGNNTLAQEILENNKIDINGNESPNALGWALLTANEPLADYLVAKGADPNHPNAVSNTLEEIICEATEPGSFKLTMQYLNFKFEKENPQRCLEIYCREASLDLPTLNRLISFGADIHCCNELPLHQCLAELPDGDKNPKKIATAVAALRDRGCDLNAPDIFNDSDTVFNKALKQGLKECCTEILKGISELGLCNILRTHREKEALRLTEKEIERRLRNLPNEILDRYKERASAQLPEFLKFAEREFSHREAQKHISKIKKNDRGNTLEI